MLLLEPTQFSPLALAPVLPLLLVQEWLASMPRRLSAQLPSSAVPPSLQPAWLPQRQELPLAPLLAWLLASPQP
ncbi:hypothetical protein [Massilia frigida]|uniref:hypothetical protein n=1 Tax=Massilia frigida TaxID=2609281 RepID=UPI0014200AF3|nr:hypothetical protein [Massilia frigida]